MAFIDYYKILGVKKDIPQDEVKAAFRKRTKQFHPDLHPNDPKAKAKFQALTEAYDVIGDPVKRKKYDQYGERWKDMDAFNNHANGGAYNQQYGAGADFGDFEGFDFNSFSNGGGGFSSFFESMFGGGSKSGYTSRQRTKRSNDATADISIDMYTALLGGEIIAQISDGSKIKLKVKPYTTDGTKVRLKGKGKDLGNGTKGDLILTYRVSLPTDLSDKQKELLKQMRDA